MPPQAKKIDRLSDEIDKKYNLQNNNPKGNNRFTPKKDLEEEPSELEQFKKLEHMNQHGIISQLGNDIWVEGKELAKKKSLFTKMQKIHFGWKFED